MVKAGDKFQTISWQSMLTREELLDPKCPRPRRTYRAARRRFARGQPMGPILKAKRKQHGMTRGQYDFLRWYIRMEQLKAEKVEKAA